MQKNGTEKMQETEKEVSAVKHRPLRVAQHCLHALIASVVNCIRPAQEQLS